MSARLYIKLLGDVAVERDGMALALPTRKAAALLAVLAVTSGNARHA
jgi:DNA-binding SARP family transcriptional activator